MPVYEYKCWKCEHKFERIKPIRDRGVHKCPRCDAIVRVAVSVPCVQPDPYWSGHMDDTFGYVTSKKQLRDLEKGAGLRRSDKGDGANARLARAGQERKEDVIRTKAISETVRDITA